MAETIHQNVNNVSNKRRPGSEEWERDEMMKAKKGGKPGVQMWDDPAAALASARHEFGEHGGVNMSIEASATFTVMEPESLRRMFAGELGPDNDYFIYSRHFNPTVLNVSRLMAAMEGTEAAYCTASGMSAISSVLFQLLSSGDHVVAARTLYGGTHALLAHFLPRVCNITTTFVDIRDLAAVKDAIVEGKTKVLYFESVANPTLTVANIPELSRIAHDKGATVVVDNTFSPMVLSPAKLGADVVVHSVSKFISGGADIIAASDGEGSKARDSILGRKRWTGEGKPGHSLREMTSLGKSSTTRSWLVMSQLACGRPIFREERNERKRLHEEEYEVKGIDGERSVMPTCELLLNEEAGAERRREQCGALKAD